MQYAEAFKKSGYSLESIRQDWSSENAEGVCLTIWIKEIKIKNKNMYVDVFESFDGRFEEAQKWIDLSGNKKRIAHLKRAVDEFGGRVDVILVSGDPGGSYGDADIWDSAKRGGYWIITKLDEETGFFRAEAVRTPTSKKAGGKSKK